MASGLGSLTLDLITKIGGFLAPLSQAERALAKSASAMEKRAHAFGQAIGKAMKVGVAAAAAGAVAAVSAIRSTITAMDDMSKAAQRSNISTESFSRLAHAANLADVSMEDLQGSLGKLAKAQGEALDATSEQARIFKALGIEALDPVTKQLTDTKEVFLAFADRFKDFKGTPEIIAAGMKIFGRSFQNLIPLLKDGSEGLREAGYESDRLGMTLSTEAGEQAELFNDNLTRLKAGIKGLVQSFAIELLPKLIELTDKLLSAAEASTVAKDAASLLATAFDAVSSASSFLYTRLDGVGKLIEGIATRFVEATAYAKAFFNLDFTSAANIAKESTSFARIAEGVIQLTSGAKVEVPVEAVITYQDKVPKEFLDQLSEDVSKGRADALRRSLSGPEPKAKKGRASSGKSDAEREAEKVARAIEQMTKAQQDWQNELEKTGNPIADEYASRLRSITEQAKGFAEDGVPVEKVTKFTEDMQALAASLRDADIVEFQEQFTEATSQMTVSMQGPMAQALLDYQTQLKEIDELLKLGIITIEEYNARMAVLVENRDAPATDMLDAINEEIMLLGMSAEQQEVYNNLKAAGVEANSKFGQSIIANTELLQQAREEAEFMQELKDGLSDMFTGFISGSKSAKEAFGDFADALFARATQFLADKAIQALFGAASGGGGASTASSSGSGGGWSSFLSGLMGLFSAGGRANGGSVSAGQMYRVNERGAEMLSISGKDYLMMGANAGSITPNNQLVGRSSNVVNNFSLAAPTDPRTQEQIAGRIGFETNRANTRNR